MLISRRFRTALLFLVWQTACAASSVDCADPTADDKTRDKWQSLISVEELHQRLADPNVLVIDARDAEQYAAGHIPGAINLPGKSWRTPATNPSQEGPGQRIFRTPEGELDVARYESFLSAAGVKPEHEVVVYGNHAGKADGTVPVSVLIKLGHKKVSFVDGLGWEQWKAAGYSVSTDKDRREPSKYVARPQPKQLWSIADVLKNLKNDKVKFLDSRTKAEYDGTSLRDNKRGGHIPGAVLLDSEEFLDAKTKKTISPADAKKKIESLGISKDSTIVIYCQTGTRCTHKELILKDLGFNNVVLYDASWQEWGNRDDTPVEKPATESPQPKTQQKKDK